MKYIMNKNIYIFFFFLYKYIYFVYTIYSREWECNIPFLEVYIPYYDLFKYRLNNYYG